MSDVINSFGDMSQTSGIPPIPFKWTDEQEKALDRVSDWLGSDEPFFALTGFAGTGKSTLVKEIVYRHGGNFVVDDYGKDISRTALTAMTGKAALRLAELSDRHSTTLHSKLYWPPPKIRNPNDPLVFNVVREPEAVRFLIVDEASMLTPSMFEHLNQWAEAGVKILLIGDPYQLPPVITGEEAKKHGDDYSVFSKVKGVELKTVMRSIGGVLRAATHVRQTGSFCTQNQSDQKGGYVFSRSMTALEDAVNLYLSDPKDHMIITWKNNNRMLANKLIRSRLGHEGPLPDVGEPVLIRKNGNGFLNGEIVFCNGFEAGPELGAVEIGGIKLGDKEKNISPEPAERIPGLLTLWMSIFGDDKKLLVSFEGGDEDKGGEPFDGSLPWINNWRKYHIDLAAYGICYEPVPITWGYCLTAHAAQGSQARRTTIFLCQGDPVNRNFRKPTSLPSGVQVPFATRWLYTAQTRSIDCTTVIVG